MGFRGCLHSKTQQGRSKVGDKRDLVIIGGGAGGLVVASVAGQLGLRVTLVEKEPKLGGDCLHYGCVPSKTLIRVAKVAHAKRTADRYGLQAHDEVANFERVRERIRSVVDKIQEHDDPDRFRSYGCEMLFGTARFTDPHTVAFDDVRLQAKRFVLATGSVPFVPPIPGLEEAGYITNEQVFSMQQLPPRLVVVGAGPIGVELSQALQRLGSEVTLVEAADQVLPREDPDLAQILRGVLVDEGINVRTSAKVTSVSREGDVRRLELDSGDVLECDEILMAVGRRAVVEGIGLEQAGVEYTARGVAVDARLRTSNKHIFACGDVTGIYPFTHMAEYQAGIVIRNTVFRLPAKTDYRVVPWVTYSDPELAHVGMTRQQAEEAGITPTVLEFPVAGIDRAITDGATTGMVKVLLHKGRIIGASLLAQHAGELIHELALAIQLKAKAGQVAAMIHAYPTMAQIHKRAINSGYSAQLFSPKVRRIVGWLSKLP